MSNLMNNKGLGIIAAVIIMLIVAVMGLTVVSLYSRNIGGSQNYVQSQQAFYLAESGVQRALLSLTKQNWTDWSDCIAPSCKTITTNVAGYGTYDVSVAAYNSNTPTITATGYVPSSANPLARRVVVVQPKKESLFNKYGALAGGGGGPGNIGIDIKGNGFSDSYDSTINCAYNTVCNGTLNKGNDGDLATNSDINIVGNGFIFGDAYTSPTGTFSNTGSISGAIYRDMAVPLSPVTVPASLTSLSSGGAISSTVTLASGNYKFTDINIKSNDNLIIIGPAQIYLTGTKSIAMAGSSKISVTGSGPVAFYFDGSVSIGGQGLDNASTLPSNLTLFGTSSATSISLSGQANFYGAIYAPSAELDVTGGGDVFGSVMIDQLKIATSWNGGLHHDTGLVVYDPNNSLPRSVVYWNAAEGWNEAYNK